MNKGKNKGNKSNAPKGKGADTDVATEKKGKGGARAPAGKVKESEQTWIKQFFSMCRQWSPIFQLMILLLIALLAFLMRVFSFIRYESVIHEYDPWFNFRSTRYFVEKGIYEFHNWYDSETWHPLGRVVGGTVFPGLMYTTGFIKWAMELLSFPLDIRNICVFCAPVFAGFTAVSTYKLTKESTNKIEAGLLAAFFMATVPSYISRSVAGAYDNEAIAIWALVHTFYLWVKAVNTGSVMWSVACALQYFYMVLAWGGYSFIINLIPIFVLGTMFIYQFNMRIYVAYSIFYTLGSILAMQITFVNFAVIRSSEHLVSHCVFILMQIFVLVEYVRNNLQAEQF